MSSERLRRVTLTGDVSGEYVVLEERSDGSLVVAPDRTWAPGATAASPVGDTRSPLARLLRRAEEASVNVPELLARWGVLLGEDERVLEFLNVEIDGTPAFLAITSQRFISVSVGTRGSPLTRAYLLSAASEVGMVRRRMSSKLRVSWHGSEMLIGGVSRGVLLRVEELLASHRLD
jgi:hypothetical protein